jgi:hypothetical protein
VLFDLEGFKRVHIVGWGDRMTVGVQVRQLRELVELVEALQRRAEAAEARLAAREGSRGEGAD